jgi:hypothetical protein
MRKSLNVLQSLMMSYKQDKINLKNVFEITGYPSDYYRIELLKYLFNNDIKLNIKYEKIKEIINESNYSIIDIIREIINYLINNTPGDNRKIFIKYESNIINIINELSKIEIYTANNTNNDSLLLSIISIIYINNINMN